MTEATLLAINAADDQRNPLQDLLQTAPKKTM
jgi:hypothetical protein